MNIRDAILRKQSEERLNISKGFELEKAKAVPIGTVNKYGEVKTTQGWVYQKKGTQKAEGDVSDTHKDLEEKIDVIRKEMQTGDDGIYSYTDSKSSTRWSKPDESKHNFAMRIAGDVVEPKSASEGSKYLPHEIGEDTNDNRFVETPIDEVIHHSITQVGTPMQYQAEQEMLRRAYKKLGKPATSLSQAIDVLKGTKRVNKELTRMGVKTHTTKDSERATQTVLSEMQREGKFDKEKDHYSKNN